MDNIIRYPELSDEELALVVGGSHHSHHSSVQQINWNLIAQNATANGFVAVVTQTAVNVPININVNAPVEVKIN